MANIINGGFLAGKRTYVVSITAVIGAVAAYLTGEAGLADTIQVVLTSILASTVRSGINNVK